MTTGAIQLRACTSLEDFDRCVELQRQVWGFADIELVPKDVIVVAASTGGQVFGAFEGGEMVGFVLAFPGYRNARPYLHSHMLAVRPESRDHGVGRRLKLKQREDALARGLELVEWTFDPLELKNAYFNVERLGVIVRRYVPNKYGVTTSPLHGGLATDRVVAEWWLKTGRVEAAVAGRSPAPASTCQRIAVPADIGEIKQHDRGAAERVQREVREQFEKWFAQGYGVTGFVREERSGVYLLEPTPAEIPR
ncbi:GNAT family N-acetyltransferase [Acidobacteriia bacterium AH_259_A11_L15]|nr:GNAT family N-acetyltransferase [Acidobacteriia bacterium AH_259_A11_L15]